MAGNTGLFDAFGGGRPVPLPGGVYFVRELRIGELVDLQDWVSSIVPPPWDVPESEDQEAVVGAMHILARDWPPRVDTGDAEKAVGPLAWIGRLLTISPGMTEDEAILAAAQLIGPDWAAARALLHGAWFGIRPIDSAGRLLKRMALGDRQDDEPGEPLDWPRTIARLCEGYPGLNPTVIRGLNLSEFRTLCDQGKDREATYNRAELPKAAAVRAKGQALLAGDSPSST